MKSGDLFVLAIFVIGYGLQLQQRLYNDMHSELIQNELTQNGQEFPNIHMVPQYYVKYFPSLVNLLSMYKYNVQSAGLHKSNQPMKLVMSYTVFVGDVDHQHPEKSG